MIQFPIVFLIQFAKNDLTRPVYHDAEHLPLYGYPDVAKSSDTPFWEKYGAEPGSLSEAFNTTNQNPAQTAAVTEAGVNALSRASANTSGDGWRI